MQLFKHVVPYSFIRGRIRLTWRDIVWGLENGLFSPVDVVEVAMERLAESAEPSEALVTLAGLFKGEDIHPHIDELADSETSPRNDETKDKWLYLVLSWVYESKEKFREPQRTLEIIYGDFGYPNSISHLVPVPSPPTVLTKEELLQRGVSSYMSLVKRWEKYLRDWEKKHYDLRPSSNTQL